MTVPVGAATRDCRSVLSEAAIESVHEMAGIAAYRPTREKERMKADELKGVQKLYETERQINITRKTGHILWQWTK
jgi:hypothetical protein